MNAFIHNEKYFELNSEFNRQPVKRADDTQRWNVEIITVDNKPGRAILQTLQFLNQIHWYTINRGVYT